MNPSSPAYIRLRTPRLGWLRFNRVYLAADHLLVIDCSGFEERYRRVLFADVQAIIIRKTVSGRVINLALGFFGAACVASGVVLGSEGLVVLGVMGAMLLILLVVNILRGPTCSLSIKTRVQLHEIKAMSRLAGTRRCVEELRSVIQKAQPSFPVAPAPETGLAGLELGGGAPPVAPLSPPSGEPEAAS